MQTSIKNIVRQTSIGWCSVYLIANIFRSTEYLSFLYNEKYKGCDDDKVNNILRSNYISRGLKVTTIAIASQNYGPLPKEWVYNNILLNNLNLEEQDVSDVEVPVTPFLLSVNLIPGTFHHVGVLVSGKRLFYIDPYFEHYLELESFDDFDRLFIGVAEVQRLMLEDGTDKYVMLKGEDLGYLSLKENILQHA